MLDLNIRRKPNGDSNLRAISVSETVDAAWQGRISQSRGNGTTAKDELRRIARAARMAQPGKDALSRTIVAKFLALPAYAAASTVMWYLDAGSEVRTRLGLSEALTHPQRVAVPWCQVETNELKLFLLRDMSELAAGAYGIPEPRPELRGLADRIVEAAELDLVMVPGLAFDSGGGRLGQGKGYYDRLLARVRPEAVLVGLAFDCQMVPEVPCDPHDVQMDLVLTETREYVTRSRFGRT